jgi:hypothetical protein
MATHPARPPRDQRLDLLRGWMQVSIFVSHIAGTAFAWFIHASWGLSDSSEQFVLLSGLALGSVFALKSARDGFARAVRDLWGRMRRLYAMHLLVAAAFAALVLWVEACSLAPGEVDRLHWRWLVEAPWAAIPGIMAMLHQPDFIGILPLFLWCMALLPAFLWLCDRIGAWALLPPAALYAAVQVAGLALPGLGGTPVAYNPFAWQFLFLLGAWCGRQALLHGRVLPRHHGFTVAVAAVVLGGFLVRLVGHGMLPDPGLDAAALLEGKTDLAPLRLLHALALAWLVARLTPRELPWMFAPVAEALAAIGRNSLHVFCLGLLLSWAATVALRLHPGSGLWLDAALVVGGIALLTGFALRLERTGAARRPAKRRTT